MFVSGHSFAGLVSIKFKSWLECWKPAESLLREMIEKRKTAGVPFHRVFETVTIICLSPIQETTVNFAVKRMKCSLIYERGLYLIEKLFTLKVLTLT